MVGYILLLGYVASIWGANWLMLNVGTCADVGPCVIPVGFGLFAPSGVLMIGASLALRDAVQERLGRALACAGIALGALVSAGLSPSLALASGAAFALGELADFVVYQPLRERQRAVAVAASGMVGGAVDSAVFLLVAFGSLDYLAGQVVGKAWVALLAALVVTLLRRRCCI